MFELADVLVILGSSYALFAGVVAYGRRHPVARPAGAASPWGRSAVRRIAITAAGGYLAFLAIVLVFHVGVVGEDGAFADAVRGGAFLLALALPAFAALSWLEALVRRDRMGRRR